MPAAGILGWKRSKYQRPIPHNSKSPETPQKLFLEIIKNIERKKYLRGGTHHPRGWGRARLPRGPPSSPPVPIFCYMKFFTLEKKSQASFRDETPPPRGGTLAEPILGSGGAVLPGKHPSGRGKLSPSSSPSILSSGGGQSPSTSSAAPSPLKPQIISCIQSLYQNLRLVPVGCQQC